MRVPGLSWAECRMRAREFAAPQPRIGGAYCAADRPEPTTFTLFVWIHANMRVEERFIPDLSEADCRARSDEIREDRTRGVRVMCIRSGYPRPSRNEIECADCGAVKGRKSA
jgi:hypothetical protein